MLFKQFSRHIGNHKALNAAWLKSSFKDYGAVNLSVPRDTAGGWVTSEGICVSFITKEDALQAVNALQDGETCVLREISNFDLEFELRSEESET
mmetsp:Transcript_12139/g.28027  ORF Transcript_12139/g.28027 Transcript_12139/m.28027 type:complete len:94 (+) Transcript_12139:98-379(+)